MFPLVLTLPLDLGERPEEVGALVGLMLGVGYAIAAVSPFALGVARDATGRFTGALWILVGVAACWVAVASTFSRERVSRLPVRAA